MKCPACDCTEVVPEKDILDVWWESGVSHTSVCRHRADEGLRFPADMYLEGSDQHRGWFQSSLLTSVGAYGVPPYESVMHCGFTVDANGEKMSKSKGNGIDPAEVTSTFGADVLRLWVASVDYSQDVRVSNDILEQVAGTYRRFRNTFRFLLANVEVSAGSGAGSSSTRTPSGSSTRTELCERLSFFSEVTTAKTTTDRKSVV